MHSMCILSDRYRHSYAGELGVLETRDNPPQFSSIFSIGNPFFDSADENPRGVQQIIWSGGRRGKNNYF
jgi:hypothetical protein